MIRSTRFANQHGYHRIAEKLTHQSRSMSSSTLSQISPRTYSFFARKKPNLMDAVGVFFDLSGKSRSQGSPTGSLTSQQSLESISRMLTRIFDAIPQCARMSQASIWMHLTRAPTVCFSAFRNRCADSTLGIDRSSISRVLSAISSVMS